MSLRLSLKCRSCGFEVNADGSDDPIPPSCPSCGSRDLEFSVLLRKQEREPSGAEEIPQLLSSRLEEAFVKQISLGEYIVNLSSASGDVLIAELEPGVYEILINSPSRSSSRLL